jgi:tol-pal system protein YbgF
MLSTMFRPFVLLIPGLLLATAAAPALAQAPSAAPATPGAAAKAPPPTQKRAPAKAGDAGAPSAPAGDAGLRQRIEQLEEQLVDMQVVIGTLESLAKSGGGSGAAAPAARPVAGSYGAGDAARLDGLETQIRALTSQLEQLAEQVRAMGGTPRKAEVAPARPNDIAEGFSARGDPGAGATAAIGGPPRFGSTTVTTDAGDAIGGLLSAAPGTGTAGADGSGAGPAPGIVPSQSLAAAPLPPIGGAEGGNPKQLYETAYAHLLQQDYAAAEAAFDDFLKRFPGDALAGNAQYWLGESHFVRGQYKAAASAFLKGYQGFGKGAKAPDSLLKLAMSLDRLGQKEAACASFAELGTRFPNATANVKTRAQAERARLGCT